MNAGKSFFDTNILLYIYSSADLHKQAMARKVFEECRDGGRIVISTQVVQEFHAVASRKLGMPKKALRLLTTGLLDLPVFQVKPVDILEALRNEEEYQISFWDALILAAAESAGAAVLYTEDLNDGQQYGAVRVVNPFRLSGER